jgi:hypothetical protein
MDLDLAIVVLIKGFPNLTRQEIKVSLYRCVAARDEEIAAELGIGAVTVGDYARQAKLKLGFTSCRLVGPRLIAFLYNEVATGQ